MKDDRDAGGPGSFPRPAARRMIRLGRSRLDARSQAHPRRLSCAASGGIDANEAARATEVARAEQVAAKAQVQARHTDRFARGE